MGIYLPMTLTLLIPVGAFLGWTLQQMGRAVSANPEFAERLGVLMATGLIVGESLFGVAFAAIVGATDNDAPLALVTDFAWAVPLGLLVFAGSIAWLYARTRTNRPSDARAHRSARASRGHAGGGRAAALLCGTLSDQPDGDGRRARS